MSILSEFSKAHGPTIAGLGLAIAASALTYTAHGAFQRFDRAEAVVDTVERTSTAIKESVQLLEQARTELKTDLADLRAEIPAVGSEAGAAVGDAASAALDRFQERRKEGAVEATDQLKDRLKALVPGKK